MIKKDNIKQLLEILKFTELDNSNFYKGYANLDSIIVDVNNQEITWPNDLVVNDKTTSNFEHSENFVVLECVDRLLSKGYRAKNMELEPRWQLGRGASGGKADILVKDNNNHAFLIIECKTFGDEFDKAWEKTLADGDQLFSYAQQIKRTQYLCLYSSDIDNNKIIYNNKIMTLKDNEDYLKTLKISNRFRYKDASDVKELYRVWKDVYNLEYEETGIFEENIVPYEINKVYSLKDLKSIGFEDTQKKYNEFATILRQHNVSGHENAFDKLINIFLAKIVDEIEHPNNLKFNWRGIAFDDYYQLQDRLQKLYKDGMQKFLNEDVTYIDNNQLNDAFKLFKNDPDATKEKVLEYFRELKFYTNNDFAFIDVHNEELFKQNSEVLLKMVKMFQDIKLKTEEQNQFLGDLFEGFLDDGVKQSEGQFFTPLPITRFIVSSLPLENILSNTDDYPNVIDYACGAGHFLNEYASEIKDYFKSEDSLQDCYSHIDGIEKEYRLSKVSKVSAFMYGQDSINITYGDALANNKNIKDNNYSILIANPPYSVKGFLETLSEEEKAKYELSKLINSSAYSTNNSIETFFVERAKQLLKSNGIAGIILPASFLTNGNSLYAKSREILIKYFDIIGIVELPSGTFGATGTNTVVMFLRKKNDNPLLADHYRNRVNSWFSNQFNKDEVFEDKDLLIDYLNMQQIDLNDYIELITKKIINKRLKENNIIKSYINGNKPLTIDNILKLEKEKLYYYLISRTQDNDVVIVNAPLKKEEVEKFLGYKWSHGKGSEGIKYLGSNINSENSLSKNTGIKTIETPLFNPNNLFDENKINTIIRNNYNNIDLDFGNLENVKVMPLTKMLNFSKMTFDKAISLYENTNIEMKSKFFSDSLGNVCDVVIGGTPSRSNPEYFKGNNLWASISEMNGQIINDTNEKITDNAIRNSNVKLIPKGTTLLSFKLSIGKTAIAGKNLYTNEAIAGLIPKDKNKILDKYLYYLFTANNINSSEIGNKAFGKSLNSNFLKNNIKIPIPDKNIQEKIINDCETIENKISNTINSIEKLNNEIEILFLNCSVKSKSNIRLDDSKKFKLSIGNRVLKSELKSIGKIPVISANINEIFGYADKELLNDFSTPYILWGIDGDWMVNLKPKGEKFYPTDHCGYLKIVDESINPIYFAKALEKAGKEQRFSRSNRASTDRVSSLVINIPSKDIQDKFSLEYIKYKKKIEKLEEQLLKLNKEEKEIVNKALN